MNWCLSYIILCVPSGSSPLQSIQAFGTIFETWTDCKGLELSGCFKSTILDRFLQEWLNRAHTSLLFERENAGSQNAAIYPLEWLGVEIYPTFSTVQLNSGCWSNLASSFSRWYRFTTLTAIPQSCKVSWPLLSSQNCSHKITDCFSKCSPPLFWVFLMERADTISIYCISKEESKM